MPITVGKPIEIDNIIYDVQKVLGKGGLSTVYLAIERGTKKKVAIKDFLYKKFYDKYTRSNDCEEYWENEILNTQAQARSGFNCVKVLHYEKKIKYQTPEYYIVLNFIEGMTFLDFYLEFIQTCRGLEHLDLASMVREIFIPIAKLLDYCHTKENIVHRDVSVENIIIQKGEEHGEFIPVLIDWGISKHVGPEWIHYTPKPFMADDMGRDIPITQKGAPPEIRFGYMPIAASDIYYLAHLMYFVFTGGIMREDSEILDKDSWVLHPKDINWYLPESYNEMVEKLTQFEPADRPKDMIVVIQMLNELIRINQIHYDFDFFTNPDTDPLTGKKIN